MNRFPFKLICGIMAAMLLLIFLNSRIKMGRVNDLILKIIEKPAATVYYKLSSANIFIKAVVHFNSLVRENIDLKNENIKLLADSARIENLKEENDFLRSSLSLKNKLDARLIDGGVFSANFSPLGYVLLLNRGLRDGVSFKDVVISGEGVFIGQVSEVFDGYSKVNVVINPDFRVTAEVSGSKISGMARGAMLEGIYFDFVNQDDNIKEGDLVITSGNDLIPPALLIGKVDLVEVNPATLFKKVRIRPAINDINLGKVLILERAR